MLMNAVVSRYNCLKCRALLRKCRALLRKCRALLAKIQGSCVGCRALWRRCGAFQKKALLRSYRRAEQRSLCNIDNNIFYVICTALCYVDECGCIQVQLRVCKRA